MLPGLYLKKETKSVITVTGTGHWRGPSGNSFTRSFIPQGLAAAAPAAAAPEVPSPADSGPFREPEGRGVTEPWGEGPPPRPARPRPLRCGAAGRGLRARSGASSGRTGVAERGRARRGRAGSPGAGGGRADLPRFTAAAAARQPPLRVRHPPPSAAGRGQERPRPLNHRPFPSEINHHKYKPADSFY